MVQIGQKEEALRSHVLGVGGRMDEKEEIVDLKACSRMNELKVHALLNILAKEGVISKEDFKQELETLCEKGKEES